MHVRIHKKYKDKAVAKKKAYGGSWEEFLCEALGIKQDVIELAERVYKKKGQK